MAKILVSSELSVFLPSDVLIDPRQSFGTDTMGKLVAEKWTQSVIINQYFHIQNSESTIMLALPSISIWEKTYFDLHFFF